MRLGTLLATALAAALLVNVAPAGARTVGDSRVVLEVPSDGPPPVAQDPGFPEGIALDGRTAYVSTPAQSGNLGDAKIYAFKLDTGALVKTLALHPPAAGENGVAGIALDGSGRVYVAGQQGLMRIDPATGAQGLYASFPNLPPCVPLLPGPCSPTVGDRPPFPNDVAFDAAGNAYVTDSFQATVWRVPPGPGTPEIWCQDASLDGAIFGPNGVRLQPDGSGVVVTVTGPPGGVFALDRTAAGCQVRSLRSYALDLPDGLAFGRSGRLYVSLAGANQVAVLAADGTEVRRFSGPAAGDGGSVQWDAPASVALDPVTSSLLVVNHALVTGFVDPSRFVVFDVFVDDRPLALKRPIVP